MTSHFPEFLAAFLSVGWLNVPLWGMVLITLALTHVTIACVTIYLHRHQAHRSLDLHPVASHLFRFWLWFTTGIVTREWVCIHRKHHAKCETHDDPHSPRTKGLRNVLFRGYELYKEESKNKDTLERYKHGTPDDWIEKSLYSRFDKAGIALLLIVDIGFFGASGLVIWSVQMLWIPVNAAGIINGLGHWMGYRNFESEDGSTNISPWGLLIGGEELHNNHHTYPTSAKLSVKPFEFDIGWMYIVILSILGLAVVKKVSPKMKLQKKLKAIDNPLIEKATLTAVITHRYELMARYARANRSVCRHEMKLLERQGMRRSAQWRSLLLARRWSSSNKIVVPSKVLDDVMKACEQNTALVQLIRMRFEFQSLWTRGNEHSDVLLHELRDWHDRARNSPLSQLRDFAKIIPAMHVVSA